ncbi:MAG: VCBS repeat-containing protein, partial [Planctomycetes bacterium]|nr:VCBS repeat-containing protein [Planctomycetota bacterium]
MWLCLVGSQGWVAYAQESDETPSQWHSRVLPVELGVGYAVRAIDLSGDGKLDIAIVDSKRIVWLDNSTWKVHTIFETPANYADNVCFAPADIDRDGDIDFAIGTDWQPNNTQSGGAVGWIESPEDPRQMWTYHPILEPEPTVHRMHWIDWNRDGVAELIVAPLKGPKSTAPKFEDVPVRLSAFYPPKDPRTQRWENQPIEVPLFVMHNFDGIS